MIRELNNISVNIFKFQNYILQKHIDEVKFSSEEEKKKRNTFIETLITFNKKLMKSKNNYLN